MEIFVIKDFVSAFDIEVDRRRFSWRLQSRFRANLKGVAEC